MEQDCRPLAKYHTYTVLYPVQNGWREADRAEYLHLILQVCPRIHGPRVKRHDHLVKKLNLYLEQVGWNILVEPKILTADSFIKPDLVIWNNEKAVVLDVAVCGDD